MAQPQQQSSANSLRLHPTKNSSSLAQSHYRRARLAVQQGKLAEAIPDYQHFKDKEESYSENGLTFKDKSTRLNSRDLTLIDSKDLKSTEMIAANSSKPGEVQMETAKTYLEQGDAFRKEGKWEEARERYQKVIELEPESWLTHHHLGDCLLALGQYNKAINYYKFCLELNISFTWSYYNTGVALIKTGRWKEAIEYYEKVDKLDPNFWKLNQVDFNIQHQVGDLLFEQQKWIEAEPFYNRAICLNPSFFWSHYNLGRVLHKLQKFEDAIASLRRAIDILPDLAEAHYTLAQVLSEIGYKNEAKSSYKEALKYFCKQVQQDPSDLKSCRMMLEIDPDNPENWSNLIYALIRLENLYEATLIYQDKIKLLRENSQVYIHQKMGDILILQGRVEQAFIAYNYALEKEPYNYSVHYKLGLTLSRQGKLSEAIVKYYEAIDLNPDDSHIHRHLGNTLAKQGKIDEAAQAYRRVLELEAREVAYINTSQFNPNFDRSIIDKNEINQKIEELHHAIELESSDSSLYEQLGYLYIKKGNIDEAFASYYSALESSTLHHTF